MDSNELLGNNETEWHAKPESYRKYRDKRSSKKKGQEMDEQNRRSYPGEENYYSQRDKLPSPRFRLFGQRLLPIFIVITTLLLVH